MMGPESVMVSDSFLYYYHVITDEKFLFLRDMITFGYNSRFKGPLRALTALAIGVVMVVSKTNALSLAVQIIAAFLIASGIVTLAVGYKHRVNGTFPLMVANTVVDILLALVLFVFPGFFANLLVYLIAFALICFGLFQLISLGSASRVFGVGVFAFILPAIVLMSGLFLISNPSFLGSAVGVVAGVALIIYGASELLSSWKMRKAMDEYDIKFPKGTENNDVDEQ
jgi:uncharacterized membrane protein HdeD (DUF308 family)